MATGVWTGDYHRQELTGSLRYAHSTCLFNEFRLVREMSFEIAEGERILIAGDSGAGKTSLLRAIAGLWRSGSGRIVRPPLSEVMFLPQRPYMILGSLREQLCYPHASRVSDVKLLAILRMVNLEDLVERVGSFDAEAKWEDLLSLGEQQRIAFARLLLNHPAYAFVDEAISALDPVNEELIYNCLASARINVVSVGDRLRLLKYHHRVLELLGGGRWRIGASEPQQCKACGPPIRRRTSTISSVWITHPW